MKVKVGDVHKVRAEAARMRRPEAARQVTTSDGERLARIERAKPKTSDVLHQFKDKVRWSKDGKRYSLRLTDKKDRDTFSEMKRPWTRLEQERGLANNALEKKVMFKKPSGAKSYVFESQVEQVERRTGMRARKHHRVSAQDVWSTEDGRKHKRVYENVPGRGLVLVEHIIYEERTKPRRELVEVKVWRRKR